MKTLGLIGGTTWHSTIDYYHIINQKMLLYSINFKDLRLQVNPDELGEPSQKFVAIPKS